MQGLLGTGINPPKSVKTAGVTIALTNPIVKIPGEDDYIATQGDFCCGVCGSKIVCKNYTYVGGICVGAAAKDVRFTAFRLGSI